MPARTAEHAVYLTAAAVFVLAAGFTLWMSFTMRGGMRMPGGWTMSMAWMPMAGQSALGAAAMFIAMWVAMMVAMMLPSTLPLLLLYRRVVIFRQDPHLALNTWALASAYFVVWTVFGIVAYGLGLMLARLAMHEVAFSRAVPWISGAALVAAGIYQLTPWKSACLRHCRDPLLLLAHHLDGGWRAATRLGLHHGAFCAACCWALMLVQLVLGVMSVPVMVAVAAVIAFEKLLARGELVARLAGVAAILGGVALIVRFVWTS